MPPSATHCSPDRMPVLFVGHGSPMNAIEDNLWSRAFRELGAFVPRPRAILSISAHWFLRGTFLTGEEHPETLHDFGGFPPELYRISYPAPGDRALASRAARLLEQFGASLRTDWGLDHGTWSVLMHMFPEADCPVVQLSIDERLPPSGHLEMGRALAPLRQEGVLIMGSGNIVHNLRDAFGQMARGTCVTPDWARAFDEEVAHALDRHDAGALAMALETENGRRANPTADHYLPLLYAAGASHAEDGIKYPVTGFDMGSLSMRTVLFG